jgi:hypothetical protein
VASGAYIEALGGELEIQAKFGDRTFPVDLRDFATLDDESAAEMNAQAVGDAIDAPTSSEAVTA